MVYRGEWLTAEAYRINDVVTYAGEAWIALRPNRGTEPTLARTGDWARVAAKGDPGPTGPRGLPGVTTIIGGGMGTGGALSTTGPTYLGLFVSSAYFTGAPSEAAQVMPVGGTLSGFHVRLRSEASSGLGSYAFAVLRDSTGTGTSFAETPVKCTIVGSALACSDTIHLESFNAGDLVVVRATPAGPVFSVQMQWTARFAPSP
jgi:hypothetical protein